VAALAAALADRAAGTWEAELTPRGVAVVEVFEGSMADFTNTDGTLRELGMVGEVDHPIFGTVLRHGVPVRFSETPGRLAPGCMLGQHTDALLAELGYSAERIDALKEAGIVLREPVNLAAPVTPAVPA
jgi:crotonobetainyl-CoA:carnitine CoA-transferase CaiB-like acyl-CoA transferase